MDDQFLTTQQAANYLGVSSKTLMRWDQKGLLVPERTVGNQRRYTLKALQDFKEKSKTTISSTSSTPAETSFQSTPPATPAKNFTQVITQAISNETARPQIVTPSLIAGGEQTQFAQDSPIQTRIPGIIHPEDIARMKAGNVQEKKPLINRKVYRKSFLQTAFFTISAVIIVGVLSIASAQSPQLARLFSFAAQQPADQDTTPASSQPLTNTARTTLSGDITLNIPAVFNQKTTINNDFEVNGAALFTEDITVDNKNLSLGTGELTASNVVYDITSGANIVISGDPQTPVISATIPPSVTSFQGQQGVLTLTAGSGVGIDGLTISNTGVLSLAGQTGNVTLTQGDGITISGTTITNADRGSSQNIFKRILTGTETITAGTNNDVVEFIEGTGIDITGDSSGKTLTFSVVNQFSGLITNGVIYADSATTLSSITPGTAGYVLQSNGAGSPPTWEPSTFNGAFSAITTGTNTGATMVVGSGASLDYTGTGTINATTVNGLTFASGKTLNIDNSLTFVGTDGTTFTFPGATGTVVTLDASQTLTNKTIAAGSNTISGLTNANLSGTAGITNANLANSSLTVSAGSGLSGGGAVSLGGSTSLALGALTAEWNQSGAFDISLNNASSELRILESAGATFFGTIDVGDLTLDRTYTFPNGSGEICLVETGNCAGSGTGVITAGGTVDRIAKFSGTQALIDASINDLYNAGVAMTIGTTGNIGIGTTNPSGLLHTNGNATGKALAIFNETGDQNILTASASGVTVAYLDRSGNLAIEGQLSDLGGTALSVNDNLNLLTGNAFQINGTSVLSGTTLGAGVTTSSLTQVGTLTSGTWNATTIGTQYGGTGLTSYTTGDIIYASGANTLAARTIGSAGQVLTVSGGVPVWIDPGGTINFWQRGNGAVSPLSSTDDLLLGSTATESAKFAFINNTGSGTPTASISGNITLNSAGIIQSTNNRPLTLGGNATGNIALNPLNGNGTVNINGTLVSTGDIQLAAGQAIDTLTTGTLGIGTSNATTLTLGRSGQSIALANFSNCDLLATTGTALTCSSIPAGITYWEINNGTVSPYSGTLDLLVGGNSSSSAVFKVSPSGTSPTASVAANSSAAGLIVDNRGNGDLFTASKSGATKFVINNAGDVQINNLTTGGGVLFTNSSGVIAQTTNGNSGQCLKSAGGATPTWGNCSGQGSEDNYWQMNNGAVSPFSNTLDLLIGSTATNAAQFSVIGVANGTPIASVAASTNNRGIYLDAANSTIQSTRMNTLTLGGSTTGNITIDSGNGLISLADATTLSGNFTQNGATTFNTGTGLTTLGGNLTVSGTALTFANNSTLTLGSSTTALNIASNLMNFDTTNSRVGIGTNAPLAKFDVRGTSGTTPVASFSGQSSFATMVIDNNGLGDLFTASKSGAKKFTVLNSGDVQIANLSTAGGVLYTNGTGTIAQSTQGISGQCLQSQGVTGAPTWGACGAADSFTINQGLLYNSNLTTDFAIGGSSSTSAKFLVSLSGTRPTASVSGATSNAALVVDQTGSGDIFTASKSGKTHFTVKNNGVVLIGNSTDGIAFDVNNPNQIFSGTARPTKKITLSPEYNGAIITASGSATTNGFMTSDASPSAALSNFQNYYEWTSSQTSLQDYTVAVRVTLPQDFSAWTTSSAITIGYNTELGANGSNKLDVILYNADTGLTAQQATTPVAMRANQNTSAKTWANITIDDSELDSGAAQDLDTAGDTVVFYIKMYSKDNNHVQLGDITLNYLAKF